MQDQDFRIQSGRALRLQPAATSSRRAFVRGCVGVAAGCVAATACGPVPVAQAPASGSPWLRATGQRDQPNMFAMWPGLAQDIPWVSLATLPSPVQRLTGLEEALGFGGQIWIKRDGLASDIYGGNKVRKLEFELAEAQRLGARSLISYGGIGSHQVCAVAAFAAQFGIAHSAGMFPQPVTAHVRDNLLFNAALGTNFIYGANPVETTAALYHEERRLYHAGLNPYLVWIGTSTPLGTLGYADMMLELRDQVDARQLPEPDAIFTALGSGGTLAGIVLGKALAGFTSTDLHAVRVVDPMLVSASAVDYLARAAHKRMRQVDATVPAHTLPEAGYTIYDNYLGSEYGQPTLQGQAAHDLLLENDGIKLEATYTDKTLAALIDYVRSPAAAGQIILLNETYNATGYTTPLATRSAIPENLQWVFDAELAEPS